MRGDIIRQMGGFPIADVRGFYEVMDRIAGQRVMVELVRDGKEMKKEVQLRNP